MKKVLIVSPHFPPVDAVDMHRIRMNVAHYPEYGWEPTVLTVKPEDAGRNVDERLCKTLPEGLEVHRVSAIPERVTRLFGLSAIGFRAHYSLARAGDALLKEGKYDLVFFSTTAFPLMTLGPRWRKKYGVPYVLDLQDPWYTSPTTTPHRGNLKYHIMRFLHRQIEMRTMQMVSGLIAVSPKYIDVLQAVYSRLKKIPVCTVPFGYQDKDSEIAAKYGKCWPLLEYLKKNDRFVCLAAGRGGNDLITSMKALFRLLAYGHNNKIQAFRKFEFLFLGTGYRKANNPEVVMPTARSEGVDDCVHEEPNRLPLLDTLKSLEEADILLVLGSEDYAYQPSKLYQYLNIGLPLLVVCPEESRLATFAKQHENIIFLSTDIELSYEYALQFGGRMAKLVERRRPKDPNVMVTGRSSSFLSKQECNLFDQALYV